MKFLYLLNPFRKLSSVELAKAELEEARRQLLISQTGLEYADAMVRYGAARVRRLENMLSEEVV